MICLQEVKRYCQEYWKIENFQEAVNDRTQTWHCHHRHEIDWALPREELISIGRYYDVHYSELIFLTPEEHNRLHHKGEKHPNYGKHHTEETREKISSTLKGKFSGENHPMYGKHHTEETKQKMRGNQNSLKYHITKEELYDLYVLQGLSTHKIAALYECSWFCIYHKLKKYNIKK